ncbi:nucleotide sugar dehydrogenase [Neptunomonas phycophila]|jgi:UDP-N-acetyl-D-galactosamine dehydrogenase|uniref:Nucleotide sugar dehydrogenase n=1 Tax=Neptunomonas phycophila TaxID=1572645 RepID=A0AAW7XN89_9GAMM|nr:nucleotide sugar dehydrogenase [Neptunomonas phycophila]MDO6454462.1 nucleotide sugar dehydrogenase [Neptunomonas phycophila]
MEKIAVVGLGYVGLPLAVAFGKKISTIGFDLDEKKLNYYRQGLDPSGEVEDGGLALATKLEYTSDPSRLSEADIIVVAVPTPIDKARRPDLSPLEGACRTVGSHLKPGAIVVFESTVYPGCSEEVCIPILEQESGFTWGGSAEPLKDTDQFFIGYSPERINPGDKVNRLETIVKIVSGDTAETLDKVATLYELVVDAGVHRAASVKVAEAAKVIENTQRDLNIALMNELSLIFHKLDIDTLDVLEAAGTKWNFLPFRPGLVGGHCIGVDPYYLTFKAEEAGHHPQVILAGRQTNDGMGKYIAEQTVKRLIKLGKPVNGAKITILGLTFKEDCPDLRNSRVEDIINELSDYCCQVSVHDPIADKEEAVHEYGVSLSEWDDLPKADAIILAVAHSDYKRLTANDLASLAEENAVVVDVKCLMSREDFADKTLELWRL